MVKSFIKQAVAVITGDDATATAEKIYRAAVSANKSQIAALEGATIDLEDKVEEAKEALVAARLNGGRKIEDRNLYSQSVLAAHNRVIKAEEALEAHKTKIAFFESELVALEKEEEEETFVVQNKA